MLNTKTVIALDFETTGLHPYDGSRPFIVGMEDEDGTVVIAEYKKKGWDIFEKIIQDPNITKLCHNAKFEIKMARHLGLKPAGKFHDTMALAVLVNEYQPINLGDLSIKHFKDFSKDMVKQWMQDNKSLQRQLNREFTYRDVPKEILIKYLEGDLDKTLKLFWLFYPYIQRNKKLLALYNMETDLAYDIAEMEDNGVKVDLDKCMKYIKKYSKAQEEVEKKIYKVLGKEINLGSSKQLGAELKRLGIKVGLTKNGNPSTAYEELVPYKDSHPFIKEYLVWKTMQKMLSTYLIPFMQKNNQGIIHPNFWQYGRDKAIRTGRFSATEPSFHTIPARSKGGEQELDDIIASVKDIIVPREGYTFLFCDCKQIEMRIFFHYIGDKYLIEQTKKGVDAYAAMAYRLYGEKKMKKLFISNKHEYDRLRDIAKQVALSLIYGMGVSLFSSRLKLNRTEALEIKREFFSQMPTARPHIMSVERDIHSKGYVEDIFGKRYHVPIELAYKGINAECQGTAAIIMKRMILKARALKKYGVRIWATIHDELALEVPNEMLNTVAIKCKEILEDYETFSCPINIDIEYATDCWANKKKYIFK